MSKFCSECGSKAKGKFCESCGNLLSADNAQTPQPEIEQQVHTPYVATQPKKKKPIGCFVAFFIAATVIAIVLRTAMNGVERLSNESGANTTASDSPSDLRDKALEFDEKTWKQFESIYIAHNNFMKTMGAYGDFNISALEFYDYCKIVEEACNKAINSYSYGETQEQKDYLSVFESWNFSTKSIAKNMRKYIDTKEMKYLSEANKEVDNAKQALIMIAENRGRLLSQAGLTPEEILDKVTEQMEELEARAKGN